ncbi:MAG: cupin domain-containing protein, partial [Wenzhouxiangellaceae bacterium]|nr:cupin domain-containing protein [Wenzhouxiangellaceae bacterium]
MADPKKGLNHDNESHNLDSRVEDPSQRPSREVGQADFAAEAHGFTGFEKAGHGSTHRGNPNTEIKMHKHVTKKGTEQAGPLGEKLLAGGDRTALRLWQDHTADGKSARTRSYEICGYVVNGTMTLIVDEEEIELSTGDSFVIPADTPHSYRISAPATVIE